MFKLEPETREVISLQKVLWGVDDILVDIIGFHYFEDGRGHCCVNWLISVLLGAVKDTMTCHNVIFVP